MKTSLKYLFTIVLLLFISDAGASGVLNFSAKAGHPTQRIKKKTETNLLIKSKSLDQDKDEDTSCKKKRKPKGTQTFAVFIPTLAFEQYYTFSEFFVWGELKDVCVSRNFYISKRGPPSV